MKKIWIVVLSITTHNMMCMEYDYDFDDYSKSKGVYVEKPKQKRQVMSNEIKKHCQNPPLKVLPFQCCPIPPLYSEEEFRACGYKNALEGSPAPPTKDISPHCNKRMCLMKNSNQLNINGSINYTKVANYVVNWANANPDFRYTILTAKDICIVDGYKHIPGPYQVCEADKISICMTGHILWNCKLKEDLPQCLALKNYMKTCKRFYLSQN